MKFYVMYAETCIEEYVTPGDELRILEKGCLLSEFQYLDHSPMSVEVEEDGGEEFPDFLIYRGSVPLISERFRQVFNRAGVDNIFYKPVTLIHSELGQSESYFLALPPRINCLNLSESVVSVEENEFARPDDLMKEVIEIVIDEDKAGNYKIFKLSPEFVNQEIIVAENLKKAVESAQLENVYFSPLKEV